MKYNILCFGDSNTWGYDPGTGQRLDKELRWPGVLARELGENYNVIEDSISGCTTVFSDPYDDLRNGKENLGHALAAHAPLSLLIISLGTNDLKYTNALGSSKGLNELLRRLDNVDGVYPVPSGIPNFPEGTKVLVISPIALHEEIYDRRPEAFLRSKYEESLLFAEYYEPVARAHKAYFLDAAKYAVPSVLDCVHMDVRSHTSLGCAIAEKIKEIFE